MTDISKTRLQVMWNRLLAVVEEQGQALIRAAFSPIVRESGDISAGIFDVRGRMLAQAVTGTPGHINTMAEAVKPRNRNTVLSPSTKNSAGSSAGLRVRSVLLSSPTETPLIYAR